MDGVSLRTWISALQASIRWQRNYNFWATPDDPLGTCARLGSLFGADKPVGPRQHTSAPPPPACGGARASSTTPPPLWASNAYVQATVGVGSVNFCTVYFGGAFFNLFYCVPCVLPDTLALRSTKFIICVKAALLANRAFVACFISLFSE